MNLKKKEYYQKIVDELIKTHGKENFTFRLMGERLGASKQRAMQIVNNYQLTIPSGNHFESPEYLDLKQLIESGEVEQWTLEDLYEQKYKKQIPKPFIRALVTSSGKTFYKNSNRTRYAEFFFKTDTREKTKCQLFADLQIMFPGQRFNFSSFCSDLDTRKIPFKKKRLESVSEKHRRAHKRRDKYIKLISSFITDNSIDPALYATNQLHLLYEAQAKEHKQPSIEYLQFKEHLPLTGYQCAKSRPVALLNRLRSLGVDLKIYELKDLVNLHNQKFPLLPTVQKMLNNYALKVDLGKT